MNKSKYKLFVFLPRKAFLCYRVVVCRLWQDILSTIYYVVCTYVARLTILPHAIVDIGVF